MSEETPSKRCQSKRVQRRRLRQIRQQALQVAMQAVERDETAMGATLIMPDGTMTYVDAVTLRRGGRA